MTRSPEPKGSTPTSASAGSRPPVAHPPPPTRRVGALPGGRPAGGYPVLARSLAALGLGELARFLRMKQALGGVERHRRSEVHHEMVLALALLALALVMLIRRPP